MFNLKLRAWSTTWEEMFDVGQINFDAGFVCMKNYEQYSQSIIQTPIVMRYSNLKDRNGKYICEGDFLFLENWNYDQDEDIDFPVDEIREVIFDGISFMVRERNSTGICSLEYVNAELAEVIGNIYEGIKEW